MKIAVDWSDLMQQIVDDFRFSPEEIEERTGVSNVTIYNILRGTTKRPSYRTIRQLEKGLAIVIDQDGLTFRQAQTKEELIRVIGKLTESAEIRVVRTILRRELIFNQENILDRMIMGSANIDLTTAGAYQVQTSELSPLISPGDHILFDVEAEIKDGDTVIVVTKLRQEYLRKIKLTYSAIILYAQNDQEPIILRESDIEAKYRVLRVIKDL